MIVQYCEGEIKSPSRYQVFQDQNHTLEFLALGRQFMATGGHLITAGGIVDAMKYGGHLAVGFHA